MKYKFKKLLTRWIAIGVSVLETSVISLDVSCQAALTGTFAQENTMEDVTDDYTIDSQFETNGERDFYQEDAVEGYTTFISPVLSKTAETTQIDLYFLQEDYAPYISIPKDLLQSYQIELPGQYENVTYTAIGGGVTVDEQGLVTLCGESVIDIGSGLQNDYKEGNYTVTVSADEEVFQYIFYVKEYGKYYVDQILEKYLHDNITENMDEMQILQKVCEFVCQYDYSTAHSDYIAMILSGEGGTCYASTDTILHMWRMLGKKCRVRTAINDPGAGGDHVNAIVEFSDGTRCIAEAGYVGTAPREYTITVCSGDFRFSLKNDGTYKITDYVGFDTTITVPETIDGIAVTEIGNNVFQYANWDLGGKLSAVNLPDSVTAIGEGCFRGCKRIKELYISENVHTTGRAAFIQCDNLNLIISKENPYITTRDGVLFTADMTTLLEAYQLGSPFYDVPEGVRHIADCAFFNNQTIRNVTFPDSLETIGYKAFCYCDFRGTLTIPENVSSVGYAAFNGLTDGHPRSVLILNPECELITETDGEDLFSDYVKLLIIGYQDSTAQEYAQKNGNPFLDYSLNQPIHVESGICNDDIVWDMSWDEKNGVTVTVTGEGMLSSVTMGKYSYYVNRAVIGEGITGIQKDARFLYKYATSVSLPDSLESIGEYAFEFCLALTSIVIPENVTLLDAYCFHYCEMLERVEILGNVKIIDTAAFSGCTAMKEVILPDSVQKIADYAFIGCTNLTDIQLPNQLSDVGKQAFYDCTAIKSLQIPFSVSKIGDLAFGYYDTAGRLYNRHSTFEAKNPLPMNAFTLQVYEDSAAMAYATQNAITYTIIPTLVGDVDFDGKSTVSDVILLQKWILAIPDSYLPYWQAADLCKDSVINVFDLVMLKRKLINR